jgi:hypothetical protein
MPLIAALVDEVESGVRARTHHQIRDLVVEEDRGRVIIRGRVPTYYAKQLALQAALALLPEGCIQAEIEVGRPASLREYAREAGADAPPGRRPGSRR